MASSTLTPGSHAYQPDAAQTVQSTTTSSSRANFRCKRGIAIYHRHADRIKRIAPWVYSVPSQSGTGVYHVYLKEGEESCSCPDWAKFHTRRDGSDAPEEFFCKHYFAARLWRAKSEECAGCKSRLLRRRMREVGEDHLTFHADDYLCAGCVDKHGLGLAC